MSTLPTHLRLAFRQTNFSVKEDNDPSLPDTCGYILYNNDTVIAEYNQSEIEVYENTTEYQVLSMAKILMIYAGNPDLLDSIKEQILKALEGVIVSDNEGSIADIRHPDNMKTLNQILYKNQEPLRF